MPTFRIAVIAGDGIGPEVTEAAIEVVEAAVRGTDAAIEWNRLPWGSEYYKAQKQIMPDDGWEQLRKHDAILMGALGSPDLPDTVTVGELLLPLRRNFDLYVNLRPAYLFDGVQSPLRDKEPKSIDMLVYRENTEGEYSPVGGRVYKSTENEVAIETAVYTARGCERIMRAAFEGARHRPRKLVTSITKSNALIYGMNLWDDVFQRVASDYPDIKSQSLLVDAAAMDLVRKPETFDVIVAGNLFGDILTDLSAMVTGSVGLASSANINPTRTYPSMFEPVHGSAPDIAGQGIANPLAAVLTTCLMLEHLEQREVAGKIKGAVAEVLKKGKAVTPDLGGRATTKDVTEAVVKAVS
ncbi:MAG: 3-isopropylmalate dehydrogenase [Gemmataceae bacterium]